MLYKIRTFIRSNSFLRKLVGYHLASSGLFDSILKNYKLDKSWEVRISNVLASTDNDKISKVTNAGELKNGVQTMHNGVKVYAGSYYGPEYTQMFIQSKGVHEPQEELAFQEILKQIPNGSTMIEMGSFWSFYSMWFNQQIPNARNIMIEPDLFNLGQGKRNFKLNKMNGEFIHAFVGNNYKEDKTTTVSVDYLINKYSISKINILHSDIQGFEYEMLQGAKNGFLDNKIDFVFISTHSNKLHNKCIEKLKEFNQTIIWERDLDATFSEDGLIVSHNPQIEFRKDFELSSRN